MTNDFDSTLAAAHDAALRYLKGLPQRDIAAPVDLELLRKSLGGPLNDEPAEPATVVAELAEGADPGLIATTAGRFFGFVEGGILPAALGADWLASTWDQNTGFHALSPAGAIVEDIVAGWLLELLGLPASASVGYTTGAQMAIMSGLAAARHQLLATNGWDVEADGLTGAPPIRVIVGQDRHATIGRALRFLGLGERRVVAVPSDGQGRLEPHALANELSNGSDPTIICAQAGNVNTGAFDPLRDICEAAHEHDAWVHVDGAFGMWAAASPRLRPLVDGIELADSWATDAHKTLNVPYDSGVVICAHPDAHRTAMALRAPYLIREDDTARNGSDWSPDSSRRARAFAIWAALRSLGRNGVARLVEQLCDHARRFASALEEHPDIEVLNDVVFNQVLLRVGDDDNRTKQTGVLVRHGGRAWVADSVWHDQVVLRISVADHATTSEDVDRTVRLIGEAAASTS
jgi:glutamate/tyrosine decarboxylase-like PLP-dependent enzyme